MTLYGQQPGTLVQSIGEVWAAFSSVSGETTLLNDESAAILEILESGPATSIAVCTQLAADSGLRVDELLAVVESGWRPLLEAGLVRDLSAR